VSSVIVWTVSLSVRGYALAMTYFIAHKISHWMHVT